MLKNVTYNTKTMKEKTVYPKLPVKFKEKWLKALRSGEYEQGRQTLLNNDGQYCCLGVACSLKNIPDKNILGWGMPSSSFIKDSRLPKFLDSKYDMSFMEELASMNDGNEEEGKKPRSFKQIANWIEKNL